MLQRRIPLRGRVDRFRLDSKILKGNPLGDPHVRDVQVYLPPEHDAAPTRRFPLFCDLVGFMGSGRSHLNWKPFEESVPERLERLVREKRMGPVIAVFPDCWTRLGGSQYINSSAVGRHADYLLREVLPEVDRRYRTQGTPRGRAVFGKSSGGYGAIVHGMKYAAHWGAVACHSGDMAFEYCYRGDVPRVLDALAGSDGDPRKWLKAFYRKKKISQVDGHVIMFLAMAAFYDPDPDAPLGFRLPMDPATGQLDETRWKRWLRHDPVRIIENETARESLRSLRGLFIDCGSKDQYHLHHGARRLHARLTELGIAHRYEEFEDDHSSVDYRMDESLPFLYEALNPENA